MCHAKQEATANESKLLIKEPLSPMIHCRHAEISDCLNIRFEARTEIQGGPGGPWPPQKFSIVVAVNLYSFISISEY